MTLGALFEAGLTLYRGTGRPALVHNGLSGLLVLPVICRGLALPETGMAISCLRWNWRISPMDEAQTLRLLGWTVGGIVGAMFVLNAIALSFI